MNARPSLTSACSYLLGEGRWRETIVDAVTVLEHEAAKVGIQFMASHRPDSLYVDCAPLNPRYTAARLTGRNFFCLHGSKDIYLPSVTRAASRLYTWHGGATLASESRALRIYYDHPEDAKHTEYAIFSCPIADRIQGRVAFNGAVWVDPALRGDRPELGGARVSQIVSSLSRLMAAYLFDVDWCIATTKTDKVLKGTAARYGWAGITAGVTESIAGVPGAADCHLMWSRREDILAEADRIVRHGLIKPERRVAPAC